MKSRWLNLDRYIKNIITSIKDVRQISALILVFIACLYLIFQIFDFVYYNKSNESENCRKLRDKIFHYIYKSNCSEKLEQESCINITLPCPFSCTKKFLGNVNKEELVELATQYSQNCELCVQSCN